MRPRLIALLGLSAALAAPAQAAQLDARARLALGLPAAGGATLAPGAAVVAPRVRLIAEGRAADLQKLASQPSLSPQRLGSMPALAISVTRDSLQAMPPEVRLRLPLSYRPLLDRAMPALGLTPALREQAGSGVGVVLAVIDTGLDVNHPDFALPEGGTRVVRYWDQTVDGPRLDPRLSYGVECHTGMIVSGQCDYDPEDGSRTGVAGFGHGTHVAGIAAGGDATYTGAAPGALIVGVRSFFNEIDLILALEYVHGLHEQWGLPFVVNLSLGTNEGPHDGTSLIERWIESHVGPGFAVVAAAGNEAVAEAGTGIHARLAGTQPATVDAQGVRLKLGSFALSVEQSRIEIYADGDHRDDLGFILFENTSATVKGSPQRLSAAQMDRGANAKLSPRVEIYAARDYQAVTDRTGYAVQVSAISGNLSDYELAILSYGSDPLDLWVVDRSGSFTSAHGLRAISDVGDLWFYSGDSSATITNPGSSEAVIAVGNWVGRTQWPTVDGSYAATNAWVGQLGATSSRGPTRDGRLKPDVVAPGQFVVSSWSGWQEYVPIPPEVDAHHMVMYGTSMASPMVAGLAAVMLERNPQLTAAQIKALLTGASSAVPLTLAVLDGPLPDMRHGYGSPDAARIFGDPDWTVGATYDTAPPVIRSAQAQAEDGQLQRLDIVIDEPARLELVWFGAEGAERRSRVPSYDTVHRLVPAQSGTESIRITAIDARGNRSAAYTVHVDGAGCGCAASQPTARHARTTALIALLLVLAAGLALRRQA